MEYMDSDDRSLVQRLISMFPSLYILSKRNNGIKTSFINIKGYNAIKKNNLVDIVYYLNNNNDVRLSGKDPILHYMFQGFKEGRKPNPRFDSDYYLNEYNDVKKSNLNPLVHYSLHGIKEGRKTSPTKVTQHLENNYLKNFNRIDNSNKISTNIVVCVHNALEDVKLCIQSIITKTDSNYLLILVNDGSKEDVTDYLNNISNKFENIIVLENKEAQGYTKAANKGMKFSNADYVILLNSDTIVSNNWLENIIRCGESSSKIGIIGPLSNAASYQSVPKVKNESDEWAY